MEDVPGLVGDHGVIDPEPLRAHLLPLRRLRRRRRPTGVRGGGGGGVGAGVGGRGGGRRGAAPAPARRRQRGERGRRDAGWARERPEPRRGSEAQLRRAQRHPGGGGGGERRGGGGWMRRREGNLRLSSTALTGGAHLPGPR